MLLMLLRRVGLGVVVSILYIISFQRMKPRPDAAPD